MKQFFKEVNDALGSQQPVEAGLLAGFGTAAALFGAYLLVKSSFIVPVLIAGVVGYVVYHNVKEGVKGP